ncbi:hypothetical protein [Streptomyces sp. NPDC054783]
MHHFEGKLALIHAVIDVQSKFVLAHEEQRLRGVKTLTGLRRRRAALVQANSLQDGSYGCALGAMSIELSDSDEQSLQAFNASFGAWRNIESFARS